MKDKMPAPDMSALLSNVVALYPLDTTVRLYAPAKVNLFIDVLERRPDGFHNLDAVNVSVNYFDEIDVTLNSEGEISMECNWDTLPTDSGNHLIKAAEALLRDTPWGVRIKLNKKIPVGAGLGGGTSDAASLIRYLSRALKICEGQVMQKALSVGSDVPYSFVGGPARVQGRGEIITMYENMPELRLALVNPGGNHETGSVYSRMLPSHQRPHPPVEPFIKAWRHGNFKALGRMMFNAFETVVFAQRRELVQMRDYLMDMGCLGACMTGTGSHLVGLLDNAKPGPETWESPLSGCHLQETHTLPREFRGWFRKISTQDP